MPKLLQFYSKKVNSNTKAFHPLKKPKPKNKRSSAFFASNLGRKSSECETCWFVCGLADSRLHSTLEAAVLAFPYLDKLRDSLMEPPVAVAVATNSWLRINILALKLRYVCVFAFSGPFQRRHSPMRSLARHRSPTTAAVFAKPREQAIGHRIKVGRFEFSLFKFEKLLFVLLRSLYFIIMQLDVG